MVRMKNNCTNACFLFWWNLDVWVFVTHGQKQIYLLNDQLHVTEMLENIICNIYSIPV